LSYTKGVFHNIFISDVKNIDIKIEHWHNVEICCKLTQINSVTNGRVGGILWRPHYRMHSLLWLRRFCLMVMNWKLYLILLLLLG